MLALGLVLAMRISTPPPEAFSQEPSSAAGTRSPYLGKVLKGFFEGGADFILRSTGFLDRKVRENVEGVQAGLARAAGKVGKAFSRFASSVSQVFYKSSPLYGLKEMGDRACDTILNLMRKSLTWASWGRSFNVSPPSPRPGGAVPLPGGIPGPSR